MKKVALRILGIFLIIALGNLSYILLVIGAIEFNLIPEVETLIKQASFKNTFFGGGLWALLAGAVLGILSLMIEGRLYRWFLWAPLYLPLLYFVGVLTYLIG